MTSDPNDLKWWGTFDVPLNTACLWQIGPLTLGLLRRPQEWTLATHSDNNPFNDTLVRYQCGDALPAAAQDILRFGFRTTFPRIHLVPGLPDKAILVRPQAPFTLVTGEEVTLHTSSPVWLRLLTDDPPQLLAEIPTSTPQQAWLGPNTREGELCYFNRTRALLSSDPMPLNPARALTALTLRNLTADAMRFERIKVPLRNLALYANDHGQLWTQDVTAVREADGSVSLRLEAGPPAATPQATRVAPPQEPLIGNTFRRVFAGLFA